MKRIYDTQIEFSCKHSFAFLCLLKRTLNNIISDRHFDHLWNHVSRCEIQEFRKVRNSQSMDLLVWMNPAWGISWGWCLVCWWDWVDVCACSWMRIWFSLRHPRTQAGNPYTTPRKSMLRYRKSPTFTGRTILGNARRIILLGNARTSIYSTEKLLLHINKNSSMIQNN